MTHTPASTLIYEYTITSAEMRSLDQNLRKIMLLESEIDPIIRGEVPGCGPDCYASLSEVILEFIMSCEGCADPRVLEGFIEAFSSKLSKTIVIQTEDQDPKAHLASAFECILRSMNGEYVSPAESPEGTYGFSECPICMASKRMGIQRGLRTAHRTFLKLCEETVQSISPELSLSPVDDGFEPGHAFMFELKGVS